MNQGGGERRLGLWDLLLYVPVGFLSELRSLLPRLAERGRADLDARVVTARSLGRVAVGQARRRVPDAVEELRRRGEGPAADPDRRPTPAAPPADTDASPIRTASDAAASPPPPPVTSLAVPEYDALSALQVVPRLEGLDSEQLHLVERYERANRGRRTILHRIEQLTSAASAGAPAAEPPVG